MLQWILFIILFPVCVIVGTRIGYFIAVRVDRLMILISNKRRARWGKE